MMGVGQKLLSPVRSDNFFVAHIRLGQAPPFLENFPKKSQIFHLGQKKFIALGQKVPGSKEVGHLITVGQKYAQLGSG